MSTINMKRVANKSANFKEAEEYDIRQQIEMKPEERMMVAKKLKDHYFGTKQVDVRKSRVFNVK